MNKKLIETIKKTFEHDSKFEKFPDFITDIHFPCFKGLVPYSEIKFQFPLTVLVGENGCGKTSVLQALETSPGGFAYTRKWFSTKVDPIPDKPRPAIWYSFNSVDAKQNVQILNTRIKHDNNPDYWEPSRPVEKYGMKPFSKEMANTPGASGTRWNGTKRPVIYLDFRGELSAFDKYFYFGDKPNKMSKQGYIRKYSSYLKKAYEGYIKPGFMLFRKKKLDSIETLSKSEIKTVSEILDKNYAEITLIKHSFYKQWGNSVYFKLQNINTETFNGNYTEAFAGSGESAVVKLVHQVYEAKKGTLVLLDEPEVSLHPGAQKRLLDFLLNQVFLKGLQVVLSTHSPAIVEELPKEAIVLLHQTPDGMFLPKSGIEPDLAFQYIGHTNTQKAKIIVEDKAAKELLVSCLRLYDTEAEKTVDVTYHAGGAKDILKEAVILSRLDEKNVYLILDGDMNKCSIPNNEDIATSNLDSKIKEITGVETNKLGFVADSGKSNNQLELEKRNYLSFLRTHLFFIPADTTEEIIWNASKCEKPKLTEENYKDRIKNWVESEVGKDVKSTDIETYRKRLCKSLDFDNEYIKGLMNIIKIILTEKE